MYLKMVHTLVCVDTKSTAYNPALHFVHKYLLLAGGQVETSRGVGDGWAGRAIALPVFGRSVKVYVF